MLESLHRSFSPVRAASESPAALPPAAATQRPVRTRMGYRAWGIGIVKSSLWRASSARDEEVCMGEHGMKDAEGRRFSSLPAPPARSRSYWAPRGYRLVLCAEPICLEGAWRTGGGAPGWQLGRHPQDCAGPEAGRRRRGLCPNLLHSPPRSRRHRTAEKHPAARRRAVLSSGLP